MAMKKRVQKSKLTKTTQAMIIQAVVESTMTFNCETRAWQKKEIREMQKIADQANGGEASEHVGSEKKSWS